MFHVGILLCIVANCLLFVTGGNSTLAPASPTLAPASPTPATQPTPATIPEMLQFHCISNHTDVDIQIDTKLSSSNSICDEGNSCRGGIDLPKETGQAKLKTCPKDTSITIVVTMSSDRNVCGGSGAGYFKLYCLTGTNMDKVVNHPVTVLRIGSIGAPTPSPKEEYEVVDLAMTLYKNFLSDPPDNTVTIGTTLYVLISSPNKIYLGVENCTAYSLSRSDNLTLLDSSGHYTTGNRNGVLLEMFGKNSSSADGCNVKTCFVSKLHAFHFKNSVEVSLECYINVCPNECLRSRRRRSSPNSDQRVVRVSMRVDDDLHVADNEGRSSGKAIGIPIFMTTILAALFAFIGYI